MSLVVSWRNFVNSAERVVEAGPQAGPGQEGDVTRLPWPSASCLPCLALALFPPSHPCGFWVKEVADGFGSSDTGKNEATGIFLWLHPNYIWCLEVAESWELRLLLYLQVSADGFHLSWKQKWWLCGSPGATAGTFVLRTAGVMMVTLIWSHQRPWEPKCLLSSSEWIAFSPLCAWLEPTIPSMDPAIGSTVPSLLGWCSAGTPRGGTPGPLSHRAEQQTLPAFWRANYTAFIDRNAFFPHWFHNLVI